MLNTNLSGVRIHSICSSVANEKIVWKNRDIYQCSFNQTTSDLGFDAARRLLIAQGIDVNEIGLLLFGSRTPDYRSPITAAVLQGRLSLSQDCICYDVNIGANGFIHLTQIGSAALRNSNKKYGLLIVGDTPSKFKNQSSEQVFLESDAATAILVERTSYGDSISFLNFSLGEVFDSFILRPGGFRNFNPSKPFDSTDILNYTVAEHSDTIEKAVYQIDLSSLEGFIQQTNVFYHSFYLKYFKTENADKLGSRLLADAAELPLLFAENLNSFDHRKGLSFVSFGEGLSLCAMRIEYFPEVIQTVHTSEIFDDFRITHDM